MRDLVQRSGRQVSGSARRDHAENVMPHRKKVIWRSPGGEVIACVEKNKVLQENLAEIRQICQDALEDAVLMGCDERQVRTVFTELIASLESTYPTQN